MPIYQSIRTWECGFYNNKIKDGKNDRVYNAQQLCELYSGIFTDGIKPNANGILGGDLAVSWIGDMNVQVAAGHGLFGGKLFNNKNGYTITLDNPTTEARYDCIIVRADARESDTNVEEDVRDTYIYVKSLNHLPTKDDLVRTDLVKEYLLAYVVVQGITGTISQSVIFDTRIDQEVCGLISGLYNQLDGKTIYAQWQEVFDVWLNELKDKFVKNAILTRYYSNQYITVVENEKVIPIGISQYNKETDSLLVYINGNILSPQSGYTILSNEEIELTLALPLSGQVVLIECVKSIDGSQVNTVVNEVRDLQEQVAILEKSHKYQYECNGLNDNELISNLVREFLTKDATSSDYSEYTIYVNGTFGATSPIAGDGTSASKYRWLELGLGSATNRKVVIDFANCSFIRLNCEAEKHYTVLFGMNVNVKNLNITATGQTSYIEMFSTPTNSVINAENCRFWITGKSSCTIARSGTFKNCRCSVTNINANSYIFNVGNESLLRVEGGEFYAYTNLSSGNSAVVFVDAAAKDAVAITYAINCPNVPRGGYYQTHAINCLSNSAKCSFTDTITTLTISAAGQNNRGVIAASKPNMM